MIWDPEWSLLGEVTNVAKITDLRVRFFRYKPPTPLVSSFASRDHRVMCLVEIECDTGITGYGESWLNFPAWGPSERQATLLEGVRPLLLGEDPTRVAQLNAKLWANLTRIGLQWGSMGAIAQSISGADLALWDLAGKIHGLPVNRMLGGGLDRVPVYASGLGPIVDESVVQEHLELGIRAFKLKVGFGVDQDVAQVERLRDLVGSQADVMVDANQAWDARTAAQMMERLAPFHIRWVEEPVAANDLEGATWLGPSARLPIAAGENLYGLSTFVKWLSSGAVHVVQPDVTKVGGVSQAWVIARMAEAWGRPYAPHFLGSCVGLLATAHMFSAVPGGLWVELDSNPNPLRSQATVNPLAIADGTLPIPDAPGWGIELDWKSLKPFEFTPGQ